MQAAVDKFDEIAIAHPRGQHSSVSRLLEAGPNPDNDGLDAELVVVVTGKVFTERLAKPIDAVWAVWHVAADDIFTLIEADGVV